MLIKITERLVSPAHEQFMFMFQNIEEVKVFMSRMQGKVIELEAGVNFDPTVTVKFLYGPNGTTPEQIALFQTITNEDAETLKRFPSLE